MDKADINRVARTETTEENWELIRNILTYLWEQTEKKGKK